MGGMEKIFMGGDREGEGSFPWHLHGNSGGHSPCSYPATTSCDMILVTAEVSFQRPGGFDNDHFHLYDVVLLSYFQPGFKKHRHFLFSIERQKRPDIIAV